MPGEMGVISVVNPETGDDAESASTVYVGDFSQAANDFEMSLTCPMPAFEQGFI